MLVHRLKSFVEGRFVDQLLTECQYLPDIPLLEILLKPCPTNTPLNHFYIDCACGNEVTKIATL